MPFARLSVQSLPGRALQRPFGLSSEWNGLFPGGWCRPRYRWRRRTIKPPDRNYDVLYGSVSPLFSSSDFTASAGQATPPGPARGKGQRLRKCGGKCPLSYLNSGLPLSLVKGVILSSAKIRFNPPQINISRLKWLPSLFSTFGLSRPLHSPSSFSPQTFGNFA